MSVPRNNLTVKLNIRTYLDIIDGIFNALQSVDWCYLQKHELFKNGFIVE